MNTTDPTTVQHWTHRKWQDVPGHMRHTSDGKRFIFGLSADSGATVLATWTGPSA